MACRVSFQVLCFNLPLYSRHTKLPGPSPPPAPATASFRRRQRRSLPRPRVQSARPRRQRRPLPPTCPRRRLRPRPPARPRCRLRPLQVSNATGAGGPGGQRVRPGGQRLRSMYAKPPSPSRDQSNTVRNELLKEDLCFGSYFRFVGHESKASCRELEISTNTHAPRPQQTSSIKFYTGLSKNNFKLPPQGHSCTLTDTSTPIYTHVLLVH